MLRGSPDVWFVLSVIPTLFVPLDSTLHNDCLFVEDMHLLFCTHLINIFLFFRAVELRNYLHPKCLGKRVSGLEICRL